ncbi:ADP-ribosylglycohydrolase family protein [Virgisporangium ochraceum]|uniref:ADP-ribosylglycohydrolase family protein n=1 Tax=Virgisporangium ochraceum TaxID=65505 RepID=UPI0019443852|nr:ADP-ribosylglycohydrolase family protein [Virgisporangium ochraceum]
MTTVRNRIAGGLLGVHAGDSLGATVEFSPWAEIRDRYPDGLRDIVGGGPFHWPPGHATDDTDLTRAVLLAYLEPGDDVVRTAADHMMAWYDGAWPGREPGSRPVDIGNATSWGLRKYRRTGDPRDAGAGAGRAGNGSLMRCIPTGLAVADRERRVRESMEISAITHDDERCTVACAAYNEIAAALLAGADPSDAVTEGREAAKDLAVVAEAVEFGRSLRPAVLAAHGPGSALEAEASGYVLDSLVLAVAAVLDPRPFADVVVDVVRVGRDTDTNGAIAGGLLGIRDGVDAIPAPWVATLQFADEFTAAADRLAGRF